jgi:GTPase SAR1 family protein
LYHPQLGFLALQAGFALSRRLVAANVADLPLEQGPLRVLLFTTMTEDQKRLDVEEEQAQIQEALLPMIADGLVNLEMPNDGRFKTFKQTLQNFQPHLLFLSGHGKYFDRSLFDEPEKPSYASFLFETDGDNSEQVKGSDLAQAFIGTAVQCVVLSACESGKTASDQLSVGLLHQLALTGIPHVIGMRESILDFAATRFNRSFCDAIAGQQRVDVALQQARLSISQPLQGTIRDTNQSGLQEISLGQWCLPILLSSDPASAMIDWQFNPQSSQSTPDEETRQRFKNLNLPQRFIGRRRELRALEQSLGSARHSKLLISGPGGQGKTALAGYLLQHLQKQGRTVLVWSADQSDQPDWKQFQFDLEQLLTNTETYDRRRPNCKDEKQRIVLLLEQVIQQSAHGLVLLFDNLETLQDPQSLKITDALTQHWITTATELAGSRLTILLTTRWLLPDWPQTAHLALEHLGYNDYLQLARQLQLPTEFLHNRDRLRQLHQTLHGNARGLTFFAGAVQGMNELQEQDFVKQLQHVSAELQTDMALETIFQQRSAEQRNLLQRMTAYQTPIAIEGIIKLALDMQDPEQLLSALQAVSLVEHHYHQDWQCVEYQVPGTVRDWLASQPVSPPARPTLQLAADYQHYLFRHERRTLEQAIHTHHAMRFAESHQQADRLVLDVIIGPLNRRGLYQTILNDWLPQVIHAEDDQTRAEALGQYGKQCHHIGDYETALSYLKQSLAIQQEIGDNAGLCATLFNMGHIYLQNEEMQQALAAWVAVYRMAKSMQLSQALNALQSLAEQIELPGGMAGWEVLAQKVDDAQDE